VPEGKLKISADGRSATLELNDIAVIDQPKWPALNATATPARMSFRAEWKATDERITYDDPQKHYRVEGYRSIVQVEARVEVPSLGFSWKSDPLKTSRAAFGLIGEESNGKYYDMK